MFFGHRERADSVSVEPVCYTWVHGWLRALCMKRGELIRDVLPNAPTLLTVAPGLGLWGVSFPRDPRDIQGPRGWGCPLRIDRLNFEEPP